MPQWQRRYDLTLETLSPLHISVGPEAVVVPTEECAVEGEQTWVLDRAALIADLQAHPPTGALSDAAPSPPAAARRRRTYRDVLLDPDAPGHEMAQQLRRAGAFRSGLVGLDDPVDDEEPATPAPGPPPATPPDWATLATRQPQTLHPSLRRWREPGGARLVRYVLDGTPRVPGADEWCAAIARLPRRPDGAILLPGSGLKGALRSILAYALVLADEPSAQELARLPIDPRAQYAARALERRTLAPRAPGGVTPNYDAGRLLIVRDAPLDPAIRARITPFGLLGQRGWRPFVGEGRAGGATVVEALPPGVTIRSSIGLDTYLLERWGQTFGPLRGVLTPDLAPLLAAGRAFAAQQLAEDARFFADGRGTVAARQVAAWQERLAALPANATLLRLGWGTGQLSKTPFRALLNRLRPADYPLPRSRRLAADGSGNPALPFGWVVCTVAARPARGEE